MLDCFNKLRSKCSLAVAERTTLSSSISCENTSRGAAILKCDVIGVQYQTPLLYTTKLANERGPGTAMHDVKMEWFPDPHFSVPCTKLGNRRGKEPRKRGHHSEKITFSTVDGLSFCVALLYLYIARLLGKMRTYQLSDL